MPRDMAGSFAEEDALSAGGLDIGRRILAVWLPSLPTDRLHRRWRAEQARTGSEKQEPSPVLALTINDNGRLLVAAMDRGAASQGVRLGMPLTDARIMAPDLTVLPFDPAGDAKTLGKIAEWATRYTPWSAPAGSDGVFLDISGCAHLFGGEAGLCSDFLQRFSGFGFAAKLAIADTPGAAWAVARSPQALSSVQNDPGKAIVPSGENRRFLAGLSISGLRLPAKLVGDLRRLGLHRIGDLTGLPRGSVTKRFGKQVLLRLDQALGRQGEPISPHLPVIPHAVRMGFAEPIGRLEDLSAALDQLLERLCKQLEQAREGARYLTLSVYRVDGLVMHRAVGTVRPVRDPVLLARLFTEKTGDIDAGFGIETLVLSAEATDRLELGQTALTEQSAQRAAHAMADLIDRAVGRFGPGSVNHLAPRQSHLPERAVVRVPVDGKARAKKAEDPHSRAWPAEWQRPVRLFAEPQPIEATAPIPDDPPVLFRWQGVVHPIALAEGPERIAPEWWLDGPGGSKARPRDYYRVEDVEGRRFWLFRHGLYDGETGPEGEGASPPAWFLHGLFG